MDPAHSRYLQTGAKVMTTIHPIPNDTQIRQIFGMLFGDDLQLDTGRSESSDAKNTMYAIYIDDEGKQVSACVCDYNFAAFAGSALTRIPIGGAEDAAKTGEFTEMMLSNLHEIMNICSRLFMNNSSPHLRLDTVYPAPDKVPDNARVLLDACQERVDFTVSIPGYGTGGLSFMCT
jgi:hypothetical protein